MIRSDYLANGIAKWLETAVRLKILYLLSEEKELVSVILK